MPEPLIAGLPPNLDLPDGYEVRFNALDPTTGAQVTGVVVTAATLYVQTLAGGATVDLNSGPFKLVSGPGG